MYPAIIETAKDEFNMPNSAPQNNQCPSHTEFVRRLDDRWREHLERHGADDKDICEKFTRLFQSSEKVNQKLNWVMGGLAVITPLLIIFMQILVSHISTKGASP